MEKEKSMKVSEVVDYKKLRESIAQEAKTMNVKERLSFIAEIVQADSIAKTAAIYKERFVKLGYDEDTSEMFADHVACISCAMKIEEVAKINLDYLFDIVE